jgi:hypothetical protein
MSVMLTTTQLAEIEARANAATKGNWYAAGTTIYTNAACSPPYVANCISEEPYVDAKFIAHARQDIPALLAHVRAVGAERDTLKAAYSRLNDEVMQILGRALGYPKFVDDQVTFPGATEADGICPGDMVAEAMAEQAAARIRELKAECERLRGALDRYRYAATWVASDSWDFCSDCRDRIRWAAALDRDRAETMVPDRMSAMAKEFAPWASATAMERMKQERSHDD